MYLKCRGASHIARWQDSRAPRRLIIWQADIVGVEIASGQGHLNFKTLSSGRLNVSAVELITSPRKFIAWVGLKQDFSRFTVKPMFSKSVTAREAFLCASWRNKPRIRESSGIKDHTNWRVKTLGAVFKPEQRPWKTKHVFLYRNCRSLCGLRPEGRCLSGLGWSYSRLFERGT